MAFIFRGKTYQETIENLIPLLLPLAFIISALILMPIEAFQFDPDEGLRISQMILYKNGYLLYSDIPSDQPPLFTVLLSLWSQFCDLFLGRDHNHEVIVARCFVLFFATVLIWTFFKITCITTTKRVAVISTVLLIFSCNFIRLSFSAMIGIPCLTFALLSIYCLIQFRYNSLALSSWQFFSSPFFSGILLGLSLLTKMFTLFLVPLMSVFWVIFNPKVKLKNIFLPLFFFLLGIATVVLLSNNFLISSSEIRYFFQFHVSTDLKSQFSGESSLLTVISFYLQDFDYFILCLWGISSISFRKDLWVFIPLSWLSVVTILLINHKPVWYHHYLLISIPLCWLAALGVEQLSKNITLYQLKSFQPLKLFSLSNLTIAFICLAFGIKMYFFMQNNAEIVSKSKEAAPILERIVKYQKNTQWLFTDMPMYGVRSNINVPPELSVISRKSLASGKITQASLIQTIEKYHPEQFVIARFSKLYTYIQDYLDKNYKKYSYKNATYLIRKDIL